MTELFLLWMVEYGTPLIGICIFFACLGAPLPASFLMLVGSSMAMTAEFALWNVIAISLFAAIAGDQAAYALGKFGKHLLGNLRGTKQAAMNRARNYLDQNGAKAVFLSRWLVSPLGPPINLVAGGTAMSWQTFTLASIAGEIIWVGLYVGAGSLFGQYVDEIMEYSSSITAICAALAVMVVLGKYLLRIKRR